MASVLFIDTVNGIMPGWCIADCVRAEEGLHCGCIEDLVRQWQMDGGVRKWWRVGDTRSNGEIGQLHRRVSGVASNGEEWREDD